MPPGLNQHLHDCWGTTPLDVDGKCVHRLHPSREGEARENAGTFPASDTVVEILAVYWQISQEPIERRLNGTWDR